MGCNCGKGRRKANPNLVATVSSGDPWKVTYSNGATQTVPDEKTARAIVAVNGGTAQPLHKTS